MIERFQGSSGSQSLLEALRSQKIVAGNEDLAKRIAEVGSLLEVDSGTSVIEQGAEDTDGVLCHLWRF